jgi:hypothetical protein
VLETLQQGVSGISGCFNHHIEDADASAFDDLDEEEPDSAPPSSIQPTQTPLSQEEISPIHSRLLPMPSTSDSPNPDHCMVELNLRRQLAAQLLNSLREVIADKSFQYSHVIRVAPCKTTKFRARSAITKLNTRISLYCRAYSRCRVAMIQLGADQETLARFKALSKQDIKCSTALLDPNKPGSSTLQLSWIWQVGSSKDQTSTQATCECACFCHVPRFCEIIHLFSSKSTLVTCICTERTVGRGGHSDQL